MVVSSVRLVSRWWRGSISSALPAFTGIAFCLLGVAAAAGQQPYKILDHWKIGGAGGWDYLVADASAHLLYVTHGAQVVVMDSKTGKTVGTIGGLKKAHGVALDDEGKFGYISDGDSNNVVVFDRRDYRTVATIPAGNNPDGIVFDPSTKTVWAFNGKGKNVTIIDAATNQVMTSVDVPGKPEFPVADGKGSVYDNIESENEIVRFDAHAKKITATWKLTNCESPSGLSIDREHRKLFAVCDGKKMAVVDADSGKQIASPTIGDGPDATDFSAKRQLVFSSNGEGTLTVVDAAKSYKVIENLSTAKGARTMTYDDETDRVYVVTAKFGPPPAPTAEVQHPRPSPLADTFEVIVVGRK
jgi:DNA-binding beta-propeller fold protein YncE